MKPSANKANAAHKTNSSSNFLVSIQHTENHSWQGSIQWLDSGEKIHFRSELEMMMLMNQAVLMQGQQANDSREWSEQLAEAK